MWDLEGPRPRGPGMVRCDELNCGGDCVRNVCCLTGPRGRGPSACGRGAAPARKRGAGIMAEPNHLRLGYGGQAGLEPAVSEDKTLR